MNQLNEFEHTADEREHVVMQLRKVVSTNGARKVKFADGTHHEVHPVHAAKVLDHYASLEKPNQKQLFQSEIDKSPEAFHSITSSKSALKTLREALEYIKPQRDYDGVNAPIFGVHDGHREPRMIRKPKAIDK
jgi:hypothetical protein